MFANSYDGRSVHLLEIDERGHVQLEDESVTAEFQPPKEPAEFLGSSRSRASEKTASGRPDMVRDEGPIKLPDGAQAHALRVTFLDVEPGVGFGAYSRLIIRDENHITESLEFVASGKRIYTIRRGDADGRREPKHGWDLAGLRPAVEKDKGGPKSPVRALADMIRLDVSVDDMAKRADYPVYVFSRRFKLVGPAADR